MKTRSRSPGGPRRSDAAAGCRGDAVERGPRGDRYCLRATPEPDAEASTRPQRTESLLAKLPLDLRVQLPSHGTVLAHLRALGGSEVTDTRAPVGRLVEWLLELHTDIR